MKPGKKLLLAYLIIIIGVVAVGVLSYFLKMANERYSEAQERRYRSNLLADELRQSSDDLTRLARTYVVTGDEKYEHMYWAILDIRNGKKARPVSMNTKIQGDLGTIFQGCHYRKMARRDVDFVAGL